jgi:predicted metalloprotease with PDZ domain
MISITNDEIQFCFNFIRIASHLYNHSSNYDHYNNQWLSHYELSQANYTKGLNLVTSYTSKDNTSSQN